MKDRAIAWLLALCMVIAMLPGVVSAAPDAYNITLTCSGPGRAELPVDSPARVGAEIGFTADPDDGYVARIRCEGLNPGDILSFGDDFYGFVMPSNDVALEITFVPAAGNLHSIEVHEGGVGFYTLSRNAAQDGECVLLTVMPADNLAFDPYFCIWAAGAELDYLREDEIGHHYELRMGSGDADIFIAYSEAYTARISVKEALSNAQRAELCRFPGIRTQALSDLHQK